MNRRQVIDLIFSGLLAVSLSIHFYNYWQFQQKTTSFVSKGARFTAKNGDELCERIRVIEAIHFDTTEPCIYERAGNH